MISRLSQLTDPAKNTQERTAIVGELRTSIEKKCAAEVGDSVKAKFEAKCDEIMIALQKLEKAVKEESLGAISGASKELQTLIEELVPLSFASGPVAQRALQIGLAMVDENARTRAMPYENFNVRVRGTDGFDGFWRTDCSGYLGKVYSMASGRNIGFSTGTAAKILPRSGFTNVMASITGGSRSLTSETINNLQPGDLIVVQKPPRGKYGHVMMYIGGARGANWAIVHSNRRPKAGGPSGAKLDTPRYLINLTNSQPLTGIYRYGVAL